MRGHRGTEGLHRSEGREGAAHGRWVSVSLVVLLHAGLYLLLRGAGESAPPPARGSEGRIRLVWSMREPVTPAPVAVVSTSPSATAAAAVRDPPPARVRVDSTPVPPTTPILHTDQADAWSFDTAPTGAEVVGVRFRRDVLEHGGADPFARPGHLPGLRMRDNSLGGRLASMARAMDCGELKGALGRGSGALVGGGHDPGAARPMGGEASAETILASMRRRGCR